MKIVVQDGLPEIGPLVHRTYAEENGADPLTHTRLHGGVAFCRYCGDTDHEEVTT